MLNDVTKRTVTKLGTVLIKTSDPSAIIGACDRFLISYYELQRKWNVKDRALISEPLAISTNEALETESCRYNRSIWHRRNTTT
jgi:hypothetical protein